MSPFRISLSGLGAAALVWMAGCAAPNVAPDSVSVTPGSSATIDVLANDTSPRGDPLIIKRVWGATKGETRINADNTVTYTARPGESGTDEFWYRAKDNHGHARNAHVVVGIEQPTTTRQLTVVPVPVPVPAPAHAPPPQPPPAVHAAPEPAVAPMTPPPPPAGTPMIQSILVTLHTTDDDKNREDAVRVVLRRGQEIVADRTFGVGELWGSDSDRAFELTLQPQVPITDASLLNLDIHKPPVGTAAGAGWAMQVDAQAHLSDGRTITLLPQTQPVKLGDGQPSDRTYAIPAVK
jgi:hypothetical protein